MEKVLITGINKFANSDLVEYLLNYNWIIL
jgi:nucleoside-diphosphate-sugar epimerase